MIKGFLGGVGLGAGLMYVLDPERGARRRATVRDKASGARHDLADALDTGWRDLAHRLRGVVAEGRAAFSRGPVPDALVAERVRATLGRLASHPHGIRVAVDDGVVTLSGPILVSEVDGLVKYVERVRGVQRVVDELTVHRVANGVPGLQGGSARVGPRPDFLQQNWAPATRLLAGTAGGALGLWGLLRGGLVGTAYGAFGGLLVLRSVMNMPTRRILGIRGAGAGVSFQKTMEIDAPIDEVFGFFSRPQNFPRFMQHVQEVTGSDGRYHWKVAGPAGTSVEWDAEVTRLEPNRMLAWKTLEGAAVEHAGVVHFEAAPSGATRLSVQLTYNPPAGVLGHVVAALFHKDPKAAMDDDLLRLKSLLELGKATAHGHEVTREELEPTPTGEPVH